MANNNLPAIINKKNILLDVIKRYINKISEKSNNRQIINNFTHIKQYGVLSMPAFRMIADEMIQKSPTGTIIMADINDLFVANKFRGKNKVNNMIKGIINQIKITLDEYECSNYKIGKMGDEIYIYIPNKSKKEADTIVTELSKIKVSELTISVGSSSDLSQGLTNAIGEADKKMAIYKAKFKSERLKSIFGNDLDQIVDTIIETQLDKMRIDLKQLKNSNKPDLRNTFDKAISQLDVDSVISDVKDDSNVEPIHNENTFEKLKEKYTAEAKVIHGENPESINEYVLAKLLSKHPVEGVISSEFFQGLGYKKVFKEVKRDKRSKKVDILAMDLSGLKSINDSLGHEEGDNAIFDTLRYLQNTLSKKGIKMYSEIIAKGGGNSYVLIEQLDSSSKSEVLSELSKYGTSKGFKYNMSIISSVQSINKDDLNKSNFIAVVNNTLVKLESDLQEQSFDRKLKDVDEIQNCINKIYQQIINMDDIQTLLNNDLGYKEKVLEMVKTSFRDCIEKERDEECLDKSSITIEKEIFTESPSNTKKLYPNSNHKSR